VISVLTGIVFGVITFSLKMTLGALEIRASLILIAAGFLVCLVLVSLTLYQRLVFARPIPELQKALASSD